MNNDNNNNSQTSEEIHVLLRTDEIRLRIQDFLSSSNLNLGYTNFFFQAICSDNYSTINNIKAESVAIEENRVDNFLKSYNINKLVGAL